MIKRWNLLKPSDEEKLNIKQLAEELNIHPVLSKLLVSRGVTNFDEAKKFFRPQLEDLHDPFLMVDMHRAVNRLNEALGHKEKILVYGDYDVDGTTSVALVYSFLRRYASSSNIEYYIPDRYSEGYGISYTGIDFAHENGYTLIIALDCGIKAIEKVKYASERGIDFIICDHHTPDDTLPDAVAVLDPKRPDSNYPFKDLSGCGVGFKLLQAFSISNNIPFSKLKKYLDLVAVSIASDIVPILGENRIMAHYGLKLLNSNPSIGLKTIIDIAGLAGKEINISDIVFKIGPRINASGRINTGKEAVALMTAVDMQFAVEKCVEINEFNQERKELDRGITEDAIQQILDDDSLKHKKTTVLYNPDWHKGVIGIVASRLIEKYYRPTIIMTKSNGFVTGSARSVTEFDIYSAIESCRDILENFGGHMYAAGLTLKEDKLPEFIERFETFVCANIKEEQLVPQIDIDSKLSLGDITPKFFRVLDRFKPFGPQNMKPVFWSENVKDAGSSRLVGKQLDHLKLDIMDETSYYPMPGIAFSMAEYHDHLKKSRPLDICYTIEENNFMNMKSIQLLIKDIKAK